jgi:hypothetical protein
MAKRITGILFPLLALCVCDAGAQRRKPVPKPKPQAQSQQTQIRRSDTTIKSTTLEVYQVFQPELKPIVKPEISPTLPPADKEPTPQQYEVPQQTLYYSYRSLPLRPLALGKDTGHLPPQNYVLLGGGNFSTILAEAGLVNLRGENWKASVQGRYLTQEGNIKNQVYRSLNIQGAATYTTESHLLDVGLKVRRNVYGRYGYDHDAFNYSMDDVRMPYFSAGITLGVRNTYPGPWDIDYHPQISVGAFDAKQGHETTVDFSLPATKRFDSSLSFQLAINGWFDWISAIASIGNNRTNHVLQFAPALDFRNGDLHGHIGLSPTIGEGAGMLLLPDITVGFKLFNHLSIDGGWQAQRIQNTMQQLTTANPYLFPGLFPARQTTRHEVFGNASLALGKHMSVWGRVAWQLHDPLPLFVSSPTSDGKDFMLVYDENVQAIVWGGGIRYAIGEDFSVGAEGTWYNFYKHSFSHVWGEPSVRLKGDVRWRVINGLTLSTYAEVLDNIWAYNALGEDVKQRGVFDFGAAGEYNFASTLSAFIRAENLLGRKNERWLDYPSFGFNIYGGLRFRF